MTLTHVQTKFVKKHRGSSNNGHNGWTNEGMQRYNELHLAVAVDRNKNSVAFQEKFVDFVRRSTLSNSTKQNGKFDPLMLPPVQIWSEKDVENMAKNYDAILNSKGIIKFGCV